MKNSLDGSNQTTSCQSPEVRHQNFMMSIVEQKDSKGAQLATWPEFWTHSKMPITRHHLILHQWTIVMHETRRQTVLVPVFCITYH